MVGAADRRRALLVGARFFRLWPEECCWRFWLPEFLTACPRNCYSTCAMKVTVQDGRLVALEPVPANEATAGGPCLKGLSYAERAHSPDRILHPLRRQDDGGFARVSWDEALDEISSRLRAVRDEFGPQSVLHYAASGTKGLLNACSLAFWRRFGGCTTTYGDLCAGRRVWRPVA